MEENQSKIEWIDLTNDRIGISKADSAIFVLILFITFAANLMFGSVSTGAWGVLSILASILVVFWIADGLFTNRLKFPRNALLLPFAGMILLGFFQILPLGSFSVSISPNDTWLAILRLIVFFLFFAGALTYLNSPKRMRITVYSAIVFAAFLSFIGILGKLSNPDFVLWFRQVSYATPFATYINQHHFASFLVMTTAVTCGVLFTGSTHPDRRMLLIVAAVMMGLGIVFTTSRGGLLSLIVVLVFLTILSFGVSRKSHSRTHQKAHLRRFWILVAANIALVLFLLVSVSFIGGSDLVLRGIGVAGPQDFSNGRFTFWANSLKIGVAHPLFGTGLDTFEYAYTQFDTWNGAIRINHAHNEYIHVFSEAGVIGLLLVLAFIVLLFAKGLKLLRTVEHPFRRGLAAGGLAACLGIVVHSFFDFPLRTYANMFMFLLCVTFAISDVRFPSVVRTKKTHRKSERVPS